MHSTEEVPVTIERIRAARRSLVQTNAAKLPQAARRDDSDRSAPPPVSRQQSVRASAGAVVAGAALGSGILRPSVAHAIASADPVPIPGGTPALGGAFHVYAPGGFDPLNAEPGTVSDFDGFVGLAYISGTVVRRQKSTGQTTVLPFIGADMRFMQGVYRGEDGRVRRGAFGLI